MARVLIVDDDMAIRQAMRACLEDANHTVQEARDGAGALVILRESRESLIALVDLHMPVMSGYDLLQLVAGDRNLARRHVYVLVTANTESLPVVQALRSQIVLAGIAKPFDLDTLLEAVTEAEEYLPAAADERLPFAFDV
ncbi:MAG TPA: response regulator [Ktedonobacterales bacterium]|nr:response regulator [Ktedonobacterales bacterium]